ncbi:MAG: hypothetical protein DWQ35_02420 [Planctomycetota bacterium]|nr:MAG: hypothetical protein DWQ35_02420 [Planctomycetota bacterium]REK27656.1 MAG: hypothetical protein DWQ42_06750 [Planctomycetota bacterium]REK38501.1 MAG: hypothetical protein DWQ46_20435 [Planctomycetota bacterium]
MRIRKSFDVTTALAIVMGYAMLFGALRACGLGVVFGAILIGLFTCVGIAQATLYRGYRAREVSIVVGIVYTGFVLALSAIGAYGYEAFHWRFLADNLLTAIGAAVYFGTPVGLFLGILIEAYFQIVANLSHWLNRRLAKREADDVAQDTRMD